MPDNIIMLDYNEIISTGGKWILLKLVFKQQDIKTLFKPIPTENGQACQTLLLTRVIGMTECSG